jgi:hypothetical protein
MATCYNPTKIDIIYDKPNDTILKNINELIKTTLINYNLPKNIKDLDKDNVHYFQDILNFINIKENDNIKNIYWDIEAQKFLIE